MRIKLSKRLTQTCSMLGTLAMLMVTGQAHAVLIDSFDTDQSIVVTTAPSLSWSKVDSLGSDILGGQREVTIHCDVGCSDSKVLKIDAETGVLNHSQDVGVEGWAELKWDGSTFGVGTIDKTGLGGVDLTLDGATGVIYDILADDISATLTMTVYTDATDFSEHVLGLPGGIFGSTIVVVPFMDFAATGGAGADFTDVGAITLKIESSLPSLDLSVDFIASGDVPPPPNTVPEPGSMLLLGTGLIGVMGYGWRRKKMAA